MASSFLGGARAPRQPSGADVASLGPSDLSDSGSDVGMGALDAEMLESDSDSVGTGERAAGAGPSPPADADILPDHLEDAALAELDLTMDQVVQDAEDTEDTASGALDHPDLDDTPGDVRGLAQEEEDEGDEAADLDEEGPDPVAPPRRS
jgi:hypothetical protein